jgi:hypothetical protein
MKSVNYDESATMIAAPTPAPPRRRRVASCLVTAALLANTLLLVAILATVMHIKFRVDDTIDQADNIIQSVKSGEPGPDVVRYTERLFAAATSSFFLGSTDGTVAGFLQDLFRYDFSGMGSNVAAFASKIMATFQAAPAPTAPCQSANGGLGCVSPHLYNAMAAVQSIAGKIANFTNVNANASSNPAMSDGLLRLDTLLQWVRNQANATAWKSAASVCNAFTAQVSAVQWYGSFTDSDGVVHTWDARSEIGKLSKSFDEICGRLVNVNP